MTDGPFKGLERVRKFPGMYTDTSRPNHLAEEVIDNSVDEALAAHAKRIDVVLFADGSCQVSDDGRGIPVDLHPDGGELMQQAPFELPRLDFVLLARQWSPDQPSTSWWTYSLE